MSKLLVPFLFFLILIPLTVIINFYIQLNPIFYVFIYSLTGIIILILTDRNKRVWVPILFTYRAIDFVLAFSGFILVILTFMNNHSIVPDTFRYFFSFIMLFLLPGWLVIRLLKIIPNFHKIPLLVITFSCSIGITSLIYTVILLLKLEPSEIIISITYTILSLISLLIQYHNRKSNDFSIFVKNKKKDYNLIEIMCLGWVFLFFIYSIFYIYPAMSENPGFDILRHYAITSVVDEYPDLLRSPYPWFHLSLGALNDLTDIEMWLFQTAVSFTSIILILTFYCVSKAYLHNFNKYLHLLSTIIFTCFSGLGWIFYYQNISYPISLEGYSSLFSVTYVATYFDIGVGQGQWLWLWFRPITLDFVFTLLLFYLMRVEKIGKFTYIVISSIVIVTLSLVHQPGLLLFVLILLSLAVLTPRANLRLKYTAISLIISIPISYLILLSYSVIFGLDNIRFNGLHLVSMFGVSIIILLLLRYPRRISIPLIWNTGRIISISLLFYGILLVYWLTNMNSIKDDLYRILDFPGALYSIPLPVFPELLGLAGLIFIPVMIIMLVKYDRNPIIIFPVIFILMLVLGRIISYVILNFQILDYWERRLVPYLWITISVLSPIAIFKFGNYMNNIKLFSTKLLILNRLIPVFFIFFLVLGGTLSTFLTLEFQTTKTSVTKVTEDEKLLLGELKELDPHSTLLTITPRSKSLAEHQYFDYNIGYYGDQMWPSSSPELPMNILNGLNSTAILYLNNQDIAEISKKRYEDGYLASHVLGNGPSIENNSKVGKLISIPRLAPPTPFSNMVLVLPNEISQFQYFAYDILSLGQYNYTTALLSDVPTIKNAEILVAPSEEIANTLIESRNDLDLKYTNLIILNLDGYGQIGEIDAEYLDPNLNYTDMVQVESRSDNVENNYVTFSRLYDKIVDLSKYDLIKIDWMGEGRNESHIIQFSSLNGDIQYEFKDSWKGNKQLFLNMNLSNSERGLNENFIEMQATENASWSDISRISVVSKDSFLNSDQNNILDYISFVSKMGTDLIESISTNDVFQISPINMVPSIYPPSYKIIDIFDNGVPFFLQTREDNFVVHYVNIDPIIYDASQKNSSSTQLYSVLGRLLDRLTIDLPVYENVEKSPADFIKGGVAAFTKVNATGNVTVESTSSTINTNTSKSHISIDGVNSNQDRLLQIIPLFVDKIIMKSNSSTFTGNYGFYVDSSSPNRTLVNFIGNPAILSLLSEEDGDKLIYGGNITISLDNADILSRQPKVLISGISNFSQFYPYGELDDKIKVMGSDFEVRGDARFDIKYADDFILVENGEFKGNYSTYWTNYFIKNPDINLLKFNHFMKLDTIVGTIIIVLIFILYNIYLSRRKKVTKYIGN